MSFLNCVIWKRVRSALAPVPMSHHMPVDRHQTTLHYKPPQKHGHQTLLNCRPPQFGVFNIVKSMDTRPHRTINHHNLGCSTLAIAWCTIDHHNLRCSTLSIAWTPDHTPMQTTTIRVVQHSQKHRHQTMLNCRPPQCCWVEQKSLCFAPFCQRNLCARPKSLHAQFDIC